MSKKWYHICILSLSLIGIYTYKTINDIQVSNELITAHQRNTFEEVINHSITNINHLLPQEYDTINGESYKGKEVELPIGEEYQLKEETYLDRGIVANYPQIISGASSDKMEKWNEIIKNDINLILQIYSLDPFPGLEGVPGEEQSIILTINNEVKLLNNQFLSIFYTVAYNSPYSAHPTELVYTTNIDTKKDTRLRLSDLLLLDSSFANSLKGWNFTTADSTNSEWNLIIKDLISSISNKDLLQGLEAADQIETANPYGIYSYLTPNHLGISISVPNYVGDHVELEKNYTDLINYLNPNYDWHISNQ